MPKETLSYTNDEVTVVWKPKVCIHSTLCWKGLVEVFNPRRRPWIKIDGASTEKIIEQVRKCPSGALSYFLNADGSLKNEG
ncbi:MAG: (4Fe-4S)-binding protein [Chitinophagaceae bacterium]